MVCVTGVPPIYQVGLLLAVVLIKEPTTTELDPLGLLLENEYTQPGVSHPTAEVGFSIVQVVLPQDPKYLDNVQATQPTSLVQG